MPLHRQRHPRGTPLANVDDTTALVHVEKMRGSGGGFPGKSAFQTDCGLRIWASIRGRFPGNITPATL